MKQCPACTTSPPGSVVRRTNRRTNAAFLGCARFPACTWTYSRGTPTGPFDRRHDRDPSLDDVLGGLADQVSSATKEGT